MKSKIAERIDDVLQVSLSLSLKQAGYRKRGRSFYSVSPHTIRVLNLQASIGNVGDSGRFTLNLGVYLPEVARMIDEEARGSWPKAYECKIRERIGALLPENQDKWWLVGPESNLTAVAVDLRQAWERYGHSWLQRYGDLREARAWLTTKGRYYLDAAAISLILGERELAQHWLDKEMTSPPQGLREWTEEWATEHGLKISVKGV